MLSENKYERKFGIATSFNYSQFFNVGVVAIFAYIHLLLLYFLNFTLKLDILDIYEIIQWLKSQLTKYVKKLCVHVNCPSFLNYRA